MTDRDNPPVVSGTADAASAAVTDAPPLRVDVGAATHQGRVRHNNEDHFLAARLGRSFDMLSSNLPPGHVPDRLQEWGHVFAVADGMGGAAAGEVASRLALTVGARLALNSPWTFSRDAEDARPFVDRVAAYFREIDRVVSDEARRTPGLEGMGTTLTVAYSVGRHLFVFHVGDTRAYLWRDGALRQLTRDQTVAQRLADSGQIPPELVASHGMRHVLSHAIGNESGDVRAAIDQAEVAAGDRFLLCSDGLTDMVSDRAILEVLTSAADPQGACDRLVQLALDAGGKDNVTVVAAYFA